MSGFVFVRPWMSQFRLFVQVWILWMIFSLRRSYFHDYVAFIDYLGDHYSDIIMDAIASQITSLAVVYSTVYSGADQRRYQNSASLAFVRGIHRWLVNSPYKGPVTRKMLPFDDVICIASTYIRHLYLNNYWYTCVIRCKITHQRFLLSHFLHVSFMYFDMTTHSFMMTHSSRWICLVMDAQIEENIKAPRHGPLWGEFTGEFPAQRASNAENASIWWRYLV